VVTALQFQGQTIELDQHGFLVDQSLWSEELAAAIAKQLTEVSQLTPDHWQVIHLLRTLYFDYDLQPANRQLVKLAQTNIGPELGSSIALMSLFGGSPAKTAARISGLPIPPHCL
jgi:tRNA 2-thiouridine synthesizing protein E